MASTPVTLNDLKVIHLLQSFSNVIPRSFVKHFARFQWHSTLCGPSAIAWQHGSQVISLVIKNMSSTVSRLLAPRCINWLTCRYTLDSFHSKWHLQYVLLLTANYRMMFLLLDIFNSNTATFNVYKCLHGDVIIIKLNSWYTELNSLQNAYFGFFLFCSLIEWHHFRNLFMKQTSYKIKTHALNDQLAC